MNTTCVLSLQLVGFVEKYAGSGVSLHTQSSSNKENRRTEGLNRYLQTLQSSQSTAPGQRTDVCVTQILKTNFGIMWHQSSNMKSFIERNGILFSNEKSLKCFISEKTYLSVRKLCFFLNFPPTALLQTVPTIELPP